MPTLSSKDLVELSLAIKGLRLESAMEILEQITTITPQDEIILCEIIDAKVRLLQQKISAISDSYTENINAMAELHSHFDDPQFAPLESFINSDMDDLSTQHDAIVKERDEQNSKIQCLYTLKIELVKQSKYQPSVVPVSMWQPPGETPVDEATPTAEFRVA